MNTELPDWRRTTRLILYHSQSTSARTLFLRHGTGSVIAPEPLPKLSTLLDEAALASDPATVRPHPAAVVGDYAASLGLPGGLLQVDPEFHETVDTPGAIVQVLLARFTCIDPPRQLFEAEGGCFCAITELRGGHPAEMGLLQLAYQAIMG